MVALWARGDALCGIADFKFEISNSAGSLGSRGRAPSRRRGEDTAPYRWQGQLRPDGAIEPVRRGGHVCVFDLEVAVGIGCARAIRQRRPIGEVARDEDSVGDGRRALELQAQMVVERAVD